jgi:hypothetical protein
MGLQAAGHQPVIAGQVAGAAGQRAQLGQQVGIGAARHGLPVTQRQIGVRCALVGRHGRPALQWRCAQRRRKRRAAAALAT